MNRRIIRVPSKGLTEHSVAVLRKLFDKLVARSTNEEVTFHFSSCLGGRVEPVLDLIKHILTSKVPVQTVATGSVHSSGALLFLVGKKRIASNNFELVLHPLTLAPKEIRINMIRRDLAEYEAQIKRIFAEIAPFIRDRTRLSTDEIRGFYSRDNFCFNLEAALKYGLVTEAVERVI